MIPWETLDRARTPGGAEMTLSQRGRDFLIRVGGIELMSSRLHGSEEQLAELACTALAGRVGARILVGGLGMGFTLRAALEGLPPQGTVTVAEIVPEIVSWNRKILGHLAGSPLEDPRALLAIDDVARVIARPPGWDAILLDVDNGPAATSRDANDGLYSVQGLDRIREALRPRGVLAVWSVRPDSAFEVRLRESGFRCRTHSVPARKGKKHGAFHTIFFARPVEKV